MAEKYPTLKKQLTAENSSTPEKGSASDNKPPEMNSFGENSKESSGSNIPFPENRSAARKSISEFKSYYDYYFNSIEEIIEFLPERYKKCPVEIIHYRPNGAVLPILFTRIMRRGQYAVVYLLTDPEGGENHVVLASLTESKNTFM